LAAATLIPIGALSWLGVRVLQQDRDVERERQRQSLEVAAGRLALEIERRLQEIEERLAKGQGIRFEPPAAQEPPASLFAAAETDEFQRQKVFAAEAEYRRLAGSRKPAERAAALVRLGRVLRKRGDRTGALQVYARLEQLGSGQFGSVTVAGEPAALVARQARCRVFEEAGDSDALRQEAAEAARALDSGGWRIDRATFDFYHGMYTRWGASPPSPEATARMEAAIQLRREWRAGSPAVRGRRILRGDTGGVLAVWIGERAWLGTPNELETSLRPLWAAQPLVVSLYDTDGQPVFGETRSGGVSLTPGQTRLPFILNVASTAVEAGDRRTVLVTGLALALVLMLAAAYGLYRATTRELMLARQQSDFVSAVSHEFRTPLTSMRHLTDLLVSRGVTSEERKAQYYELLAHETERLHRMVESLLSFGRIEVGAYAWRKEPADAGELLRGIVEEFRREPQANGREIRCEIEEGLPSIQADHEALTRALWNLLENAVKYSEPAKPIGVFARRDGGAVLLGVEDEGSGIAPGERDRIFQKFARGADAKRAGIRGVGIGLALVKRIVEAHGGTVQLQSEPGRGSTFTLVFPCPGF